MLPHQTKELLIELAQRYETQDFIKDDPVSFPHRWNEKKDIEIAGFIAQWLAYGKRELFLRVLDTIGRQMGASPYSYIMNGEFEVYRDDSACLYRFFKRRDFYFLCVELYNVYSANQDMESVIRNGDALQSLTDRFGHVNGIPSDKKSACKRLNMFLRWMVRQNSPVDFGLWKTVSAKDLIIPLDTHVFRLSKQLGLTERKDASMKTAVEITERLKEVFEDDPVRCDFALFGYGVTHQGDNAL